MIASRLLFVKLVRTLVQIVKNYLDYRADSERVFQHYTNVRIEMSENFEK